MGHDDQPGGVATSTAEPQLKYDADGNPYWDYGDGTDAEEGGADASSDDGSADASSDDGADASSDDGSADASGDDGADGSYDDGGAGASSDDGSADASGDDGSPDASSADKADSSLDGIEPDKDLFQQGQDKAHELIGYDTWQKILNGDIKLASLEDAKKNYDDAKKMYELGKGGFEANWQTGLKMLAAIFAELAVVVTGDSRVDRCVGFTYGVMWGATGRGEPQPPGPGNWAKNADGSGMNARVSVDAEAWGQGVADAKGKLTDDLRNKILLNIVDKGDDGAATLQELWEKVAEHLRENDKMFQLSWPDPSMG